MQRKKEELRDEEKWKKKRAKRRQHGKKGDLYC